MVGSIYNMGVSDKGVVAWVYVASRSTLQGEAEGNHRYQETGCNLENGGCIRDPHIVMEPCLVFLCILHCCMAIGPIQVAFIESCMGKIPTENAVAVQRVRNWSRTGVQLGASAAPDGEESQALFLEWEAIAPLCGVPGKGVAGTPPLPEYPTRPQHRRMCSSRAKTRFGGSCWSIFVWKRCTSLRPVPCENFVIWVPGGRVPLPRGSCRSGTCCRLHFLEELLICKYFLIALPGTLRDLGDM